jgi:adenylate cyclase
VSRRVRTTSIRTSLLRNVVALVLLMSVTLLAVTVVGSRQAVRNLSARLIEQSANQAGEQLAQFFGSIENILQASRSWREAGLVRYESAESVADLNALFIPILDAYPQITSMMVANDSGLEYLLFRDLRGGGDYEWYNRVVLADVGPDAGFEMLWTEDGELFRRGPLPDDARDYDPRNRPFYQEPPLDEVFWTDPYYFFITKDAGMTACYKWRDDATGQTWLIAYDLLLMDLSTFTASRRPSENGQMFVMLEDGSLVGLPRSDAWPDADSLRDALRNPEERAGGETIADRSAQLMTAEDFGLDAVARAAEYRRSGTANHSQDHFRFTKSGEAWWGGFRPFELGRQTMWIGVVVPEDDFLLQVRRQRNVIVAVAAAALLLGVFMAGLLARRFSLPLELLADQSARVRELDLSGGTEIESRLTEVQKLADANAQMMTALDSFARYVPIDLVRELLRRGEVARIGGTTETVSILFTDIEGFTTLAEQMEPDELTAQMAEYFGAMLEVLNDEKATIDKFIGDAIVAFWGAPNPNPQHARCAVRAIVRALVWLDQMNAAWRAQGKPELRTRFGLAAGEVLVGNIGAPERLDYTVLGDTVNLASRLESLNRAYGTWALVTGNAVKMAGEGFVWQHIDRVTVKGRSEIEDIYTPLGEEGEVSPQRLDEKKRYESALEHYFEGKFEAATAILERAVAENGDDRIAQKFLERVLVLKETRPIDWDGFTDHKNK